MRLARELLAMRFNRFDGGLTAFLVQSRVSPVSRPAILVLSALAIVGLIAAQATHFTLTTLPNAWPVIAGVVGLDIVTLVFAQTRIVQAVQLFLYGFLYLVTICLFGVLAAYALQRMGFPLRDDLLNRLDLALGFDWPAYAHWVGRHEQVQKVFYFAYNTISLQIALPLVVLAFANRTAELRTYLLAFTIAFATTIVISALMPACGPIVFIDPKDFGFLHFSGATPVEQLMRLRQPGAFVMTDAPGGIATFPSFHSTVALLTPLALRRFPRILAALLVVDALMLGATLTEGAHYLVDVLAGSAMAFAGYALAARIIAWEDRPRQIAAPAAAEPALGRA
ncbi:MAG: phosphatase PAP2 family protein [Pseudolabrys sp.]